VGLHDTLPHDRARAPGGSNAALSQALHQLFHVLTQAPFGNGQRRHVLATLLGIGGRTVTQPVERARDHLTLTRNEPVG
jgi:hypothetical protein